MQIGVFMAKGRVWSLDSGIHSELFLEHDGVVSLIEGMNSSLKEGMNRKREVVSRRRAGPECPFRERRQLPMMWIVTLSPFFGRFLGHF